jgi:hypothetical protein
MSLGPDGLGALHQVLDLREIGVRVAVVDQRIQVLHRLPDAHLPPRLQQVLALLPQDESQRLVSVVEPIELFDAGPDVRAVVAEAGFGLLDIVGRLPVVQVGKGTVGPSGGRTGHIRDPPGNQGMG